MKFGWESEKEKKLRWVKVSAEKKLEALRGMNELQDMALSEEGKKIRRKLRERGY